ncbi:MAG: hypothetical protein KAJ01_06440 [Candidatus Hydrogenedentes bacterium]|nr:hypothetical protein [Candidatus Hydrogenedentota bacterium]
MTAEYHENLARARIMTVIASVTDIGQVHDYERFADDWDALIEHYVAEIGDDNTKMLRGWNVSLSDLRQHDQETFGPPGQKGTVETSYYYTIRGFHAVEDASETEKKFVTLCLLLIATLDAEPKLHSSVMDDGANGNFYGPPASAARWDFRMFGDVLVHYVEIGLEVKEIV